LPFRRKTWLCWSRNSMARSRLSAWLVTLPPFAWIALFLFTPYCLLFCYSFWSLDAGQQVLRHATLTNYLHLATTPLYLTVILRSMRIAFSVVVLSLLIGYPLACFLVFQAGKYRRILYQAVIIPLWISYLVRAYAWKVIFGNEGVMNTLLLWCHATRHPLGFLLYSPFAVIVTLTHIYVPFVVLPVVASLEKIPHELLESSSDLGATAWQTFARVILPLSLPGVLSGATFAFLLSFGDFLSPLLLGGPSSVMIANIVANLFGADYNWPLGAAVAVLILVMVLVILTITQRLERRWRVA
jgi:spermidine/putrescine transport system permease protein